MAFGELTWLRLCSPSFGEQSISVFTPINQRGQGIDAARTPNVVAHAEILREEGKLSSQSVYGLGVSSY